MRYLIAVAVLALALSAVAQPWRYVDEKGTVHITSDIMELPPKQRARILERMGLAADAGKSLPIGTGRRPGREDERDAGAPPPAPDPPATTPPARSQPAAAPRPAPAAPPRTLGGDENAVDRPGTAPTGDAAADEKRWQVLVREARERIADAEHERAGAQAALEQAQRQAITVPSGQALAAREAAQIALAGAEQKVALAKAALEALQEQARRQGVPPGWIR